LEDARREIKRIIKETGISPEDLLTGLQEEREKLYQETCEKIVRILLDSNVILSGLLSERGGCFSTC
jgi:hypothetical protein